ncbi:MAG: hypothetical protein C0402_04725 [Thermodesulfovibrio sp.]|nr:hypothetical protein [Thermodesulfovibrio sp.]
MSLIKSNKIFALLLLLYFVGFAVSPVSAIFPPEQLDHSEQKDIFSKQKTQADLFFFDLALWEILKKAKCSSDNSAYIISSEKNDEPAKTIGSIIIDGATEDTQDLFLYSELTRFRTISLLSVDTTPRLTHSGLSPPSFLNIFS